MAERSFEPLERFDDVAARSLGRRFSAGVHFAFSGASWAFSRKELRLLSALTIALNLVLYIGLLVLGFLYLDDVVRWIGPDPAKWEGFWQSFMEALQGLIKFVLAITWLLLSVFLALALGNVVAGPFFDLLSERTEALVVGRSLAPPFSLVGTVRTVVKELLVQLGLLGVYLPVVGVILVIGLLPVVGQILAPVLTWMWTALWVTMTFTTQATARHGLGTKARLRLLFSHKVMGVGFGGIASVVPFLLIPIFAPALVVGGTRLFLALAAHGHVPSRLSEADKALIRSEAALLSR